MVVKDKGRVEAMQVDAPAPCNLVPPCGSFPPLPPWIIPANYRNISRTFLTNHPIHLTLESGDMKRWMHDRLEYGIAPSYLHQFLEEYNMFVQLTVFDVTPQWAYSLLLVFSALLILKR